MCRVNISFVLTWTVLLSLSIVVVTNARRCYQFTWLGPRYTNTTVHMNSTCNDAIQMSSGVPCREPLVVSDDGTWPDVEYIWEHHKEEATCIPVDNDICATYTYYFNGIVENSTYLCTRAVDNTEQAITRGCYEQRNGDHVTRACFCTSIEGAMPCNDASVASTVSITILFCAMIVAFKGIEKCMFL